ncbi:4'-phosphopantetheinyl transferase superfamily protein [Duganella sp. HH105]|uniref:4'-phosphopantetheinyl transferase family protein n=1 Tax=Duganella sp. HH105 TaxID=1781067 RepID=UPI000877D6E0|nr:4'-phosphopantetheinyl transferase superfamily protein [Duganella sp. HH105]OEZ54722.1 4'-phosphopantetheinyl transferase sfp [Duganella sp. HH105]
MDETRNFGKEWTARLAPPAPDSVHLWALAIARPAVAGTAPRSGYSRRTLRALLGRYLGCTAEQVPLISGEQGKPVLATSGGAPLHFNTSHSGALLVHAFATRPLGIDVEQIGADLPWTLASRFLTGAEFAALQRLAPAMRRQCFYAAWVRKEAYIKGHACRRLSHQFEVSVAATARQALVSDRVDPLAPLCWTVADLQLMDGYAAALAIQGPHPRILHCSPPPP